MIREAGVSLAWGDGFGPAGKGKARVTIFQPEELIKEALRRMDVVING